MSRWLAAAVVLGCWGCAFTLDGPDPNRPRNSAPTCDSSKGLVALDGVMATALGVTALSLTSESEPAVALVPLGLGALYLAGAVSGNRKANECQAALDDYSQRYGDERMVLEDDSEGASPLEDEDAPPKRRSKRQAGQGVGGQPTYPANPAGYPQQGHPRGYPQQQPQGQPPQGQTPYQQPSPQQVPPPQVPQQQVPPQQAPQQPPQQPSGQAKPAKTKAPPPPDDGDGDWSDFWREVP